MKIVAFLQNQWFKDPTRMKSILERLYKGDREQFIRTFLFFGCLTGKRLTAAFGKALCNEIVWENASPEIGDFAAAKFAFDANHVASVIRKHEPKVVLAFGKVARAAVMDAFGRGVEHGFRYLPGPHPAARHATVIQELAAMAKQVQGLIDANEAISHAT